MDDENGSLLLKEEEQKTNYLLTAQANNIQAEQISHDLNAQDNQVSQRRSYQPNNLQVEIGEGYRLSTIEEEYHDNRIFDEKENQRVQKIIFFYSLLLVLYILLILTVVLLFFFSESFRDSLLKFFHQFERMNGNNIMILFLIGVLIKVTGFPITIYELIVSFVQQNYWVSLPLLALAKVTGCYLAFLVSKYNFAKDMHFWIHTQKQLLIFAMAVQKYPMRVSFLVRFMWLPIFVKNYGLGLFKIHHFQFLIPTILHCTLKSSFICFVGINLKNLYDAASGETLADNIVLKVIGILFSLLLFFSLYLMCKKQYEILEKEILDEEKKRLSILSTEYPTLLTQSQSLQQKLQL